jgi:glycine/D-amino acid oxidase-like deaminating enzyme
MELSYWEKGEIMDESQIVVIGAGIVGLATALSLKKKKPKTSVIILEKGALPTGASTKNAGFACFGSVTEILSDLKYISWNEVVQIVRKRYEGLGKLKTLVSPITMEYKGLGGYEVFLEDREVPSFQQIELVNQLVYEAIGISQVYTLQPYPFEGAFARSCIYNYLEGQLNPAKMMKELTKLAVISGVHVLYNAKVKSLEDRYVLVEHWGKIPYRKLAVCTNGFAKDLIPQLDVSPARNQVLVTNTIPNLKLKGTFHLDEGYIYFRNIGNRILLGGGRNQDIQIEETSNFGFSDKITRYLKGLLFDHIIPNQSVGIDSWWSGIMGVGASKSPIIKKIESNQYVGVRLGGMGVAIGVQTGEDLADLICKE